MVGFYWRYNMSGGHPMVYEYRAQDTETFSVGDLGNIESGLLDLAATNDGAMVGPIEGASSPLDNVAGRPGRITAVTTVTQIRATVSRDAVLGTDDANARLGGAQLDIAGATGAQTVATDSNHDVVVVKESSAVEETLVMIAEGEHFFDQA